MSPGYSLNKDFTDGYIKFYDPQLLVELWAPNHGYSQSGGS